MIRYRLKPGRDAEHLALLEPVYAELEATGLSGDLRWATLRAGDGAFVEWAAAEELPHPLPRLESFRRYRAGLEERCEEREFLELHEVASYRMFRSPS